MSNKKEEYSLCTTVDNNLAKEFQTEVINQHGHSHGNMGKCIKEAIQEWVEKSKKKRIQKEKLTEQLNGEKIKTDV